MKIIICAVVAIFVLIVLAAAFGVHFYERTKTYSATAEIEITPETAALAGNLLVMGNDMTPKLAMELMQAGDVLKPVVVSLKLDQAWATGFPVRHPLSLDEATTHLEFDVLKIEVVPGTNDVRVTAFSDKPQEAADIANAVIDNFIANEKAFDSKLAKQFGEKQQEELVELKSSLLELENKYQAAQATLKQNPQDAEAIRISKICADNIEATKSSIEVTTENLKGTSDHFHVVSRAVASPK